MEIFHISDINDLPKLDPSSCVIGNFDGLHLGHQMLIKDGKRDNLKLTIITFEGLNKKDGYLTNTEQRIKLIESLGVDYLIVLYYPRIRLVFFHEFIKIMKKLKIKEVTCGKDFRFGYKAEGDSFDLQKHFKLKLVEFYEYNRLKVSTSVIKEMLLDGNLAEANTLLSYPYTIIGKVFSGNKIGRTLGYPTANIYYDNYLLPKNGVYVVNVIVRGIEYRAMANIGYNPTLNLQEKRRLEVHIIDFNDDIYDEEISVSFLKYLRGETKYSSKQDLINSLKETVEICRNF